MIKMTYIVATYISISSSLAKISATKQQLNYAVMIYILQYILQYIGNDVQKIARILSIERVLFI